MDYDETQTPEEELYAKLASPFAVTFKDTRGGATFDYITGEQVTTRLNEELGFLNWNFVIKEHGIHAEADEAWVLGELAADVGGITVTKQHFGSQKIKRSRSSGAPMDIGFDLKGAATDALKKCASLIGVGLYLWKKEPATNNQGIQGGAAPAGNGYGNNGYGSGPRPQNQNQAPPQNQNQGGDGYRDAPGGFNPGGGPELACEECGEPLTETRFKDGTNWPPDQLATFGRRKHSRVLCMTHYREANNAKRRAEEALQQVPF